MQPGYFTIMTKEPKVLLTKLIMDMKYIWKVKTVCCTPDGNHSESGLSELQDFKTKPPYQPVCNPPMKLKTDEITSTGASLKWNKVPGACYYIIVYHKAGSPSSEYKYTKTADTVLNLTGLLPDTKYEWAVKSICCTANGSLTGESPFSKIQSFTTLQGTQPKCLAPKELASGDITSNSAVLKWEPVPGACVYLVVIYPANSPLPYMISRKTTVPYIKIDGLAPDTQYNWKVKTYCCTSSGNWWAESEFSAEQTFKTQPAPVITCKPPTDLQTTDITVVSAKLQWKPAQNAIAYLVYMWTDSLHYKYWQTKDNIYIVQGLKPATKYFWKVRSICYSSENSKPNYSDWSQIQKFETKPIPQNPCLAPKDLLSGDIGAHKATLAWGSVENAKFYIIVYKPASSTNNFRYAISKTNKYLLEGLKANTDYIWKVKTVCGLVNIDAFKFSDFSQPAYFKTLADSIEHKCLAPAELASKDVKDTSAVLTWSPVSTAKLYAVVYREAKSDELFYKVTPDNAYTLTKLKPNTKYIWRVGSICGYNNWYVFSKFSDTASFVTGSKEKKLLSASADNSRLDMTVYPNPTEGMINVTIMNSSDGVSLNVFNITGESVFTEKIENSSGIINKDMDLSLYPKGVYFIKVMNSNSVITTKVILH
jgi:hypothetical protein